MQAISTYQGLYDDNYGARGTSSENETASVAAHDLGIWVDGRCGSAVRNNDAWQIDVASIWPICNWWVCSRALRLRLRQKASEMDPFAPLFYMALALAAVAVPYAFILKYQIDRDDREAGSGQSAHPAE